jgi:hypothetical protein
MLDEEAFELDNANIGKEECRVHLYHKRMDPFTSCLVSKEECALEYEKIKVTDEQIVEIEKLPQKSEGWIRNKQKRIGASDAGTVVGNCKYQNTTPQRVCSKLLWDIREDFNENMLRGVRAEPMTTGLMTLYFSQQNRHMKLGDCKVVPLGEASVGFDHPYDVWMEERNFTICKEYPFLGASSDGLFGNIYNESKAPATNAAYPVTPPHYYVQFTQGMYILKMTQAVLSVYTERGVQLRYHDFDHDFWHNECLPSLKNFYFNQYLPRVVLRNKGMLQFGCLDVDEVPAEKIPSKKENVANIAKKLKTFE